MAKWSGVRVDEFGFGFPPKLFGKKWRGTEYTINAIPLGGFVKIKGVAGDDSELESGKGDQDSFSNKPFWQKFLILFMGILMNMVLALFLFSVSFFIGVDADPATLYDGAMVSEQRVVVSSVLEGSPADRAGIVPGDELLRIDENLITLAEQTSDYTAVEGAVLNVQSYSEKMDTYRDSTITVETIQYEDREIIGIGVGLQNIVNARYGFFDSIWLGMKRTVWTTYQIGASLVMMIKNIFIGGGVSEDVAGPIGIAVITGEVARIGLSPLLQLTAVLSINLALFNFLPIPALDGGRMTFVVIERLRGKPVNHNIEAIVHNTGFFLLLLLVIVITFKDIGQFL